MKTAKVVIGSGYGDEGKGLMTDYFCSQTQEPGETLVIRYNGGAQAGHTVVTPDFERHVFSHLGSGSALRITTYLGADFIVNPVMFNLEFEKAAGRPTTLVDKGTRVTLPHDMLANQFIENHRKKRHGSCGVGIFETINRNLTLPSTILELIEMTPAQLKSYIEEVKLFYYKRFDALGMRLSSEQKTLMGMDITHAFQDSIDQMSNRVLLVEPADLVHFKTLIFEGAQGLLLSEHHGVHPHLTPSDPGILGPLTLCEQLDVRQVDAVYVTRAYTTKHGAGPMVNECTASVLGIRNNSFETNVCNEFQGELRYSPFDPECAKAAIKDFSRAGDKFNVKKQLAITCIDQLPDFTRGRAVRMFEQYGAKDGYISTGPTRLHVNRFDLGSMDG